MAQKSIRTRPNPRDEERRKIEENPALKGRADELSEEDNEGEFNKALIQIFNDVDKGFQDQAGRADDILDYWDIHNCKLNANQFYSGTSQIYVPIVHDAISARRTRFVNQMFPSNQRFVEVTSQTPGQTPHAETALAEHYVRMAKLRTQVMPALMRNGDVEGQYTVAVSWETVKREVVWKTRAAPQLEEGGAIPGAEEHEDIHVEPVEFGYPCVEVIADSDLLVLPNTSDSLEGALQCGGSVTLIRRWTTAKIEQMVEDGEIRKDMGKALLADIKSDLKDKPQLVDKPAASVDAVGIKKDGRGKYALIYETWTMLYVTGHDEGGKEVEKRLLCRVFFGGQKKILGCKRNPYWCDKLPILSTPVEKLQGSFKGKSLVSYVDTVQYQANDAVNEAMDSAAYALFPIVMTDPEKNPKIGSMILSRAAIWQTNPQDTQFAQFPPIWKDGLEIVGTARAQIFQTMGVNTAQITMNQSTNKRPNKAEIANEQQIDILSTADVVSVIEDEILTPAVTMFLEHDHQFRNGELMVRAYGPLGVKEELQTVPPLQMDKAFAFRWFGVEQARNAQQVQQQIAALNVVKGIPPQMYPDYKLDLGPILEQFFENTFGPRIAPKAFKDAREELQTDIPQENELLSEGFTPPVHIDDNHQEHIKAHMQAAREVQTTQAQATFKVHINAHLKALDQKQQMQMAQQAQQTGGPQKPNGAGPPQGAMMPPGGRGGPRPGAQPAAPRGGQQPPGAIHADRMDDPAAMPRQ